METTTKENLTCPVCAQSATHRYTKGMFAIARCTACNTLFVENPPSDTAGIYNESYFVGSEHAGGYGSYDEEKEAMRATFEQCLDRIGVHQKSGALFDIGAATGYFLALAKKRGYRVSGVDISAAAASLAAQKGINVIVGSLDTIELKLASFEVVTAFDVLEHVPRPSAMVESAAHLLRPGGIFMGCTPDSLSLTARVLGRRWHLLFPPEHLVLLNDASLRLLLQQQGFEVLWTGRILKRFSLTYILQTAARWTGIRLLQRIGQSVRGTWLSRVPIPLDLHDNLFFIARKTA